MARTRPTPLRPFLALAVTAIVDLGACGAITGGMSTAYVGMQSAPAKAALSAAKKDPGVHAFLRAHKAKLATVSDPGGVVQVVFDLEKPTSDPLPAIACPKPSAAPTATLTVRVGGSSTKPSVVPCTH